MPRTTILRRLVNATRPAPIATTLPRHLSRAARRSVIGFALFAAPVAASFAIPGNDFGVGVMEYATPETGAVAIAEQTADERRAARLVERHDCWTENAPAGVIPGGVVLAERGEQPRYYGSDAIVGGALDHLFGESDPTIVAVFGFCR